MKTEQHPTAALGVRHCAVCLRAAVTVERCGKHLCAAHATLLRKLTSLALDANLRIAS